MIQKQKNDEKTEIDNLNCIRKISLVKKQRTIDYEWIESVTFSQWFKNLFGRKENKLKTNKAKLTILKLEIKVQW